MNLKPLVRPLGDGSMVLYDRIIGWVTAPKYREIPAPEQPVKAGKKYKGGKGDEEPAEQPPEPELDRRAPLKRVGLLLGGTYVVASSDYTTYAAAAASIGWVVAAYMVSAPEAPADVSSGPSLDQPTNPRAAITEWLATAIGDRPGIHLYELYPRMRALPGMEGHEDTALREALVALDIPITRAFTIGDIRGRSGVRLVDLATPLPAPGESPLSSGEDAGETAFSAPEDRPESALSSVEEPTREVA
ncbi:hypothetical protein ACFW9O_17725 [Streptomyces sp. NPDC059499]|uniref:hypothetical protein n=1 Tax=Streptomyces sp. NPDC059499 TaxID=3346852 RepID=UPI0036932A12